MPGRRLGTMPNGTDKYWTASGTPEVPFSTGNWKFEMVSTHTATQQSDNPADTSQTQTINVTSCS
ncbi:hypothetical protein ACWGLO_20135 [Streptomyces niveus]